MKIGGRSCRRQRRATIETWSHQAASVRIVSPSALLREVAAVTDATERPFGPLVHRVIRFANNAIWPGGQEVKTSPFHGGNTGSIPVRVISDSFDCLLRL